MIRQTAATMVGMPIMMFDTHARGKDGRQAGQENRRDADQRIKQEGGKQQPTAAEIIPQHARNGR
ncbi:hypothetical protein, partial [Sphingobium sp.]|uniref:hypothetical protein n=1 Tax=Sphingobium sp. TaxID=1912891 RepID=UPI002BAB147A